VTFDAPLVLILAPLVGGAVWFVATWARRARIRRAARWSEETERRARSGGRYAPSAIAFSAFLGAVALAGPRWGEERLVAETRGLNLVIAVDISRSMLAQDASPSRLRRAVREADRLVQDLDGDRLGLIAFAGQPYVLSPLTIDGSALNLFLDALDPDIASEGGTGIGPALSEGTALLKDAPEIADRVLVVFTDGEAHDSLPDVMLAAQRIQAAGIHLILVAEGGRTPVRIPVRDESGQFLEWQKDDQGQEIKTAERDDVLSQIADAAQGTLVPADLPDQAGAVRDLVAAYKRARTSETRTERGRPRAWIPLFAAFLVLLLQSVSRRSSSLVAIALLLGGAGAARAQTPSPRPRSAAEKWWDAREPKRAADAYAAELARRGDDTSWFNTGTAALAAGDAQLARASLSRASASIDPDLRFRALYNLGLLELQQSQSDSANRDAHLADAERDYREALLLRPHHLSAKWNLELAVRRRGGGSGSGSPPPGQNPNPGKQPQGGDQSGGDKGNAGGQQSGRSLTQAEADAILRSIGQEELRTRRGTGRVERASEPGIKDW